MNKIIIIYVLISIIYADVDNVGSQLVDHKKSRKHKSKSGNKFMYDTIDEDEIFDKSSAPVEYHSQASNMDNSGEIKTTDIPHDNPKLNDIIKLSGTTKESTDESKSKNDENKKDKKENNSTQSSNDDQNNSIENSTPATENISTEKMVAVKAHKNSLETEGENNKNEVNEIATNDESDDTSASSEEVSSTDNNKLELPIKIVKDEEETAEHPNNATTKEHNKTNKSEIKLKSNTHGDSSEKKPKVNDTTLKEHNTTKVNSNKFVNMDHIPVDSNIKTISEDFKIEYTNMPKYRNRLLKYNDSSNNNDEETDEINLSNNNAGLGTNIKTLPSIGSIAPHSVKVSPSIGTNKSHTNDASTSGSKLSSNVGKVSASGAMLSTGIIKPISGKRNTIYEDSNNNTITDSIDINSHKLQENPTASFVQIEAELNNNTMENDEVNLNDDEKTTSLEEQDYDSTLDDIEAVDDAITNDVYDIYSNKELDNYSELVNNVSSKLNLQKETK